MLSSANFIKSLVDPGDNVKAVQYMDRVTDALLDDLQIWLPHIRTHVLDKVGSTVSEHVEELRKGLACPLLSDPKQTHASLVDLIDQSQIIVVLLPLYLVDANGSNSIQAPVLQAPINNVLDRIEHLLPGCLKAFGDICPRQYLCPARKKLHIRLRQLVLAIAPGHVLDLDAACSAMHTSHHVKEEHRKAPERNKLEAAGFRGVVISGCGLMAPRADRRRTFARLHLDLNACDAVTFGKSHCAVNKTLEFLATIQDGLHKHLPIFRCLGLFSQNTQYQRGPVNALQFFLTSTMAPSISDSSDFRLLLRLWICGQHLLCCPQIHRLRTIKETPISPMNSAGEPKFISSAIGVHCAG